MQLLLYADFQISFNDRGCLSTSKYTINNFRLNYYGKNATNSISDKAFHNQLRKPEFITFIERLLIRLSAYIGKDNPCTVHQELANLLSSLGISDDVSVDGSIFFVRLSCRNHFDCNTVGRKRTQRGVQQENAGIKVHVAFSNLTGAISHVTITEGTGSERAQVRADEYAKGTLFTTDRGYIDYDGENDYSTRNQFHLIRYRDNIQGVITEAYDGITMAPIPELIGESPSCELSSTVSAEYIEMKVVRKVEDYPVMVVRVRTPEGNSSYYGTNMSKDLVPAKALYLLYRCRWEGSEHTFKALQSGDGMRAINSSIKDIIVTFLLGNLLTYTFKQMVASVAKRIALANGSFCILRIHTVFELSEKIISAFSNGTRSSIYNVLHKEKDRIIESCTRKEASKRDKQTFKDLPTVVKLQGFIKRQNLIS